MVLCKRKNSLLGLACIGLIALSLVGNSGCGGPGGAGGRGDTGYSSNDPGANSPREQSSGNGEDESELGQIEGQIEIDGSSTVYPMGEAAAVEFRKKFPKIEVTVGQSGTGGGFKRFTTKETSISNASRPIKDSEFNLCKQHKVAFLELPIAYDGLSIVVNPKNDFVEQLTIDDLKKIFLEGQGAKTWKDVNEAWPDLAIKIYAPGKDSGTFDYFFSDVVAKDGGTPLSDGVSFSEDDNILVTGVAGEKGAIGFFGAAYLFENQDKLKAVKIVNPESGNAVAPTPETIKNGQYAPFSRPLFIYVNVESLKSPAMKKFVEFYLENAGSLAERVGYVALPDSIYELARAHYEERLTGTHFLTKDGKKRTGLLAESYKSENLVDIE